MVKELRGKGLRFTSKEPVEYPNGSRWAFIHPKEMFGVLFALIARAEPIVECEVTYAAADKYMEYW